MLCHWVNGFWQSEDMTIHPNTANHKTNNAESHTQQHVDENLKIMQNFNCFEAILCKQLNPNYNMQCHPSHTTLMWDTGLCTVRMSRSVDNCITQCPLNLTSEHIKTLLHHYYVLRYLERTPASYSPCTDITSLHSSKHYKCTLQNMVGSGNICISAVPNGMTCDIDRTQGMRF